MTIDHRAIEDATIRAFVVRNKQDRFVAFLSNPKTREKFTRELAHFRWFDHRFAISAPWKVDPTFRLWDGHTQGIAHISRLLKSKGARHTCWVISENSKLDGRELELDRALGNVIGQGMGTILSCVPGRLAFFEGEDESLVLAR